MKRFLAVTVMFVFALGASPRAQETESAESLKELARSRFDAADYPAAIEYLERARKAAPDDAEVYYLLGYYTHYLCYDSVPLPGFGRGRSDEVLGYLRRSVELDPGNGDAFYFIGAEYGARAREEMRAGDAAAAAEEFRKGRSEGGYPGWLLEWGRNLLRSCAPDAILFTGGDADTNPVQYLQVVENVRTDVTVVPVALLDRPWFVRLLKTGLEGALRPAPVGWSEAQILDMHPYKWKTRRVRVPVAEATREELGLSHKAVMWELAAGKDGRLDAGRAAMADILVTNRFDRPVCFSSGVSAAAFDGLEPLVQISGVVRRLLPTTAPGEIDAEATERLLLDETNFEAIPTLRTQNMPRASGVLVNYHVAYLYLALHYSRLDDAAKVETVLAAMRRNVPADLVPLPPSLRDSVEKLERWAQRSR